MKKVVLVASVRRFRGQVPRLDGEQEAGEHEDDGDAVEAEEALAEEEPRKEDGEDRLGGEDHLGDAQRHLLDCVITCSCLGIENKYREMLLWYEFIYVNAGYCMNVFM